MLQIVLPGTAFVTDHIKNFIKYRIASNKTDTTWARLFNNHYSHAIVKEKENSAGKASHFRVPHYIEHCLLQAKFFQESHLTGEPHQMFVFCWWEDLDCIWNSLLC